MKTHIQKPLTVEAITWDELIAFGKRTCNELVGDMPKLIVWQGCYFTFKNDETYVFWLGDTCKVVTPDHVVFKYENGAINSLYTKEFNRLYTPK